MGDLQALQERILKDKPQLQRRGITITSVGIGVGVLDIAVAESNPAAISLLERLYGANLLRVRLGITYRLLERGTPTRVARTHTTLRRQFPQE